MLHGVDLQRACQTFAHADFDTGQQCWQSKSCHATDLVQSLEHHELCSFKSLSWRCLQVPRCSITVYHCQDPALLDRNTLSLLKVWEATLALHLLMRGPTSSSVGHGPHTCWQMQEAFSHFITLQNRVS